jgi:hypothetical protein
MDLTYNTHLRCINFYFGGYDSFSEDLLFAISTLSRIGSRQLERVTFHLGSRFWGKFDFPNTEWIQMDAILTGPQFATLKDVRIPPFRHPPHFENLSTLFATLLPTCHVRGVLSFTDP